MNKPEKDYEKIQQESIANSPIIQWMMRYILFPIILLLWLVSFEMWTYVWYPDFMSFSILIFSSYILYVYIPIILKEGPKWQHVIIKIIFACIAVFILLGALFEFIKRDDPYISSKESNFIEEKLKTNPNFKFSDFTRLEDEQDNFIVLGKKSKRIYPFSFSGLKKKELTIEEQFEEYIETLLPKDFKAYRNLIEPNENNTPRQILYDYYGWRYPNYTPFVYVYSLQCQKSDNLPSEQQFNNCSFYLYEGIDRSLPYRIKPIPIQGFTTRFKMYYKALKDVFFPTFVREDLKNDPYFLIEAGKYDEARTGLDALPPKRKAFCEAKLKALGQ